MKSATKICIFVLAVAVACAHWGAAPVHARQSNAFEAAIDVGWRRANAPLRMENTSIIAAAITSAQARQIALARYGGTVLRISQRNNEYRVKLETSSGVIIVRVHAETGQILGVVN